MPIAMTQRPSDCHVHTEASNCGRLSVAWCRERSRELGVRFAVADHCYHVWAGGAPMDNSFWEGGTDYLAHVDAGPDRLMAYATRTREALGGSALLGMEVDVINSGESVVPEALLDEFFPRLGAIHFMETTRTHRPLERVEEDFRRKVMWLIERCRINVLAHPYREMVCLGYPVTDSLLTWTVDCALDAGIALEVNSLSPYPEIDRRMAVECAQAGVSLAVGTDTHRAEQFGDFHYHEAVLDAAGLVGKMRERILYSPEDREERQT